MPLSTAYFRFYEELNDFLSFNRKKKQFPYQFEGKPSVKDAIEAIGVPHTEVEIILANGTSVGFDYHLQENDFISVYPVFESLDVSPILKLRSLPLRKTAFILDVHLGKLSRILRLLGFDVLYRNDYQDSEIIDFSIQENRIILTKDRGILKNNSVTHGYCVRSSDSTEQAQEVLRRFDLYSQVKPFARCIRCNGHIEGISKTKVLPNLPPKTAQFYKKFYICSNCGHIYWRGSHFDKMLKKVEFLTNREKIDS